MFAVDIYRPELWHDFFIMVGGGTAALTGLVFVAMSLNVASIAEDPTHRYRAIGTLSGFAAVFMICALALMGGQNHVGVGLEWLILSTVAAIIYIYGYVQAVRLGGSPGGLHVNRVVIGSILYLAQIVGALLFTLGLSFGIYLAAIAMVIYFPLLISGAWLLIVRVYQDEVEKKKP